MKPVYNRVLLKVSGPVRISYPLFVKIILKLH